MRRRLLLTFSAGLVEALDAVRGSRSRSEIVESWLWERAEVAKEANRRGLQPELIKRRLRSEPKNGKAKEGVRANVRQVPARRR